MFIARPRPEAGSPALSRPGGWAARAAVPLAFLAVAILLRAQSFLSAVIDPDEGLYLVQAQAWLDGRWPYVGVWDMHPPGAPALLALVHAVVPEPVLALRLAGALAAAATATGLHAIAVLLGAGRGVALAAGLLYIAHTLVLGGLATNTELLFAPFVALVAWILLGEALREGAPRALPVLAAGLAAGIALWVKQVTALESSALWLTMAGSAWAAGRLGAGRLFGLAALFALGAGLPSLGTAAGYWIAGELRPWVEGNVLAPLAYAQLDAAAPGARRGLLQAFPLLSGLLVATAGLAMPDPVARRAARWLLPWMAAAFVAVVAPLKFFDHYFLILLPPLCLLAAFGLGAAARHALRPAFIRRGFLAAVALVAALPVAAGMLPKLSTGIGLLGTDPVRAVARAAVADLAPEEALFVANWHVMTYALAGRAPPTRYAFPLHLSGRAMPEVIGVDLDAELHRVLALPPGAIVVDPTRWTLMRPEARAAVEAALARDYRLAATVADGRAEVQVWRRR